jgi:hypothetical protein
MPQISFKTLLLLLLMILVLSHLHVITALARAIVVFVYDAFEPIREAGPVEKFTTAAILLALLYLTIFVLINNAIKKRKD